MNNPLASMINDAMRYTLDFVGTPAIFRGVRLRAIRSRLQGDVAGTDYGDIDGMAFTLRFRRCDIMPVIGNQLPDKGEIVTLPDLGDFRLTAKAEIDAVGETVLFTVGALQR